MEVESGGDEESHSRTRSMLALVLIFLRYHSRWHSGGMCHEVMSGLVS